MTQELHLHRRFSSQAYSNCETQSWENDKCSKQISALELFAVK